MLSNNGLCLHAVVQYVLPFLVMAVNFKFDGALTQAAHSYEHNTKKWHKVNDFKLAYIRPLMMIKEQCMSPQGPTCIYICWQIV